MRNEKVNHPIQYLLYLHRRRWEDYFFQECEGNHTCGKLFSSKLSRNFITLEQCIIK